MLKPFKLEQELGDPVKHELVRFLAMKILK